jgi:hypothetical protein
MKRALFLLFIVVVVLCTACSTTTTESGDNLSRTSLGAAKAGDLTVELLTQTRLETGMTPVYVRITSAEGVPVTDATVTFVPMMAMGNGKNHSAPVIGTPTLIADGTYELAVVFQMASTDVDVWSATVGVTLPGAAEAKAQFPLLTVTDSGRAKPFLYTAPDNTGTKYIASINFVEKPKVGLNPVVVTLHRMQDMMTFPPVDDATIALDPQMPSMGHGSPGSENPTLTSLGRYQGKLSFSMPGEWVTTLTITVGGVTIGAPAFTTTF